jgi:two-component system cell cycle response regulator
MSKILVVDDQPDNVFILQDRLEKEGFEVITAYEGETGIKKANEDQPDIILLDIMMPGMSGYEVCSKLLNDENTKYIPIILVTALSDAKDLKKGLDVGAFDYIEKPFNKTELIARINSALKIRESNQLLIEIEKFKTYAATVLTANHEIKQPLTLINLSVSAIRRELSKENITPENVEKRIDFIQSATKKINEVLGKLSTIKKPTFKKYLKDKDMIDIDTAEFEEEAKSKDEETNE